MLWRKRDTENKSVRATDRRNAKRYGAEWRVSFSKDEEGWHMGTVTDAGIAGISFFSAEPCPLHTPLSLTISIPGYAPIHCVAEPVREQKEKGGSLYGAKFVKFTGEGEEALRRALLVSLQQNWARENYVSPDQQRTRVVRVLKRN